MSDEIQRTPAQLARIEARARRKAQVDAVDVEIAAAQAELDGHNNQMQEARVKAVAAVQRLDGLQQQRAALLSPLATAPESEILDETISVSE